MLSAAERKERNIPADVDVEVNIYGDEQFVTTNPERQYVVGDLWDCGTQLGWAEEHRTLVPLMWDEAHSRLVEDLTREVEQLHEVLREAKALTREAFQG